MYFFAELPQLLARSDSFRVKVDRWRADSAVEHPRIGCRIGDCTVDELLRLEADGQEPLDIVLDRPRAWSKDGRGWATRGNDAVQRYLQSLRAEAGRRVPPGLVEPFVRALHKLVQSDGYTVELAAPAFSGGPTFADAVASSVGAHHSEAPWVSSSPALAKTWTRWRARSFTFQRFIE